MFRDIFFVLMVLSVSVYAHANKNKIINFIEVSNEEKEDISILEDTLYKQA